MNIKNIALAYVNGNKSHSVVSSIDYHLKMIKGYKSEGFEKLDDFDFYTFNLRSGKNRGRNRILKDFRKMDKIYIFDDEVHYLEEALGKVIVEENMNDRLIIVNTSLLEDIDCRATKEWSFGFNEGDRLSISHIFLAKIFFDIDNDFKPFKSKNVYIYNDYRELIRDGDKAIKKITLSSFDDFIKKTFCPYSYPNMFDSKEELYEHALTSIEKRIQVERDMIISFEESIKGLEKSVNKYKEDFNTLEALAKIQGIN